MRASWTSLCLVYFTLQPAFAQIKIKPEALDHYNACINNAANNNNVSQIGSNIKYTCVGNVAFKYYNYLIGIDIETVTEKEKTGTWISVYQSDDIACGQKIANASGFAVASPTFQCVIFVAAPPS